MPILLLIQVLAITQDPSNITKSDTTLTLSRSKNSKMASAKKRKNPKNPPDPPALKVSIAEESTNYSNRKT